ncbi:MAG: hypothetical protein U1F57_07700 [bacterium]
MKRILFYFFALLALTPALCCGSSSTPFKPSPGVLVVPTTGNVVVGQTLQFEGTPQNDSSAVIWSVDGGNAFGTIDATGLYTAPAAVPAGGIAVVRAKLTDNNQIQDTAEVNILAAPPAP